MRILSLIASVFFLLLAPVSAQEYERVDVNNAGEAANFQAHPDCDMSDDGRFVVFASGASNLDALEGPAPTNTDIFLRDRLLAMTIRITAPSAAQSIWPKISGNGGVIAFVRGGNWEYWTRATGVTAPIVVPGLVVKRVAGLDRTGTYAIVAVAPPFTIVGSQIYRMHLASGALVLCSRDLAGNPVQLTDENRPMSIDAEGTHVAFSHHSPLLVAGDTNGVEDVFAYDIPGNVMFRVSVNTSGGDANGTSLSPSISANGRYVAFASLASNLIDRAPSVQGGAFVRDLRRGITTLVTADSHGVSFGLGMTGGPPYVTDDGLTVAFATREPLDPSDTPPDIDACVKDLATGAVLAATPVTAAMPDARYPWALSADGREVLVSRVLSVPTVPGVTDSIYVAKFGPRCSTSNYCTSLPNSTGTAATIGAQGGASRALNNLVIAGLDLPNDAIAMLVSGVGAIDPGTPFGNGLRCVGGTLVRHGIHLASGGVMLDFQDVNAPEYAAVHPGDTRNYQIIYRDPAAGGALFNTSDAVAVTFCW